MARAGQGDEAAPSQLEEQRAEQRMHVQEYCRVFYNGDISSRKGGAVQWRTSKRIIQANESSRPSTPRSLELSSPLFGERLKTANVFRAESKH
eukprot:scaffold83090_cov48-Phaeocystis_antarctica.AAC.2